MSVQHRHRSYIQSRVTAIDD